MPAVNWALILEYIDVLIWPVVVVVVLWIFRGSIRSWFNRLPSRITGPWGIGVEFPAEGQGAVEADFENEVDLDEEEAFTALLEELRADVRQELQAEAAGVQEYLVSELTKFQVNAEFERLFNRIFGSQVFLLERLRDGPKQQSFIDAWWVGVQEKYPVFAERWTRDDYLAFLFNAGLIEENVPGTYELTAKGNAFLAFLVVAGYDKRWRSL